MKKFYLGLFFLCVSLLTAAQPYSGSRQFDGEHRTELSMYLMGGYNVVSDGFGGEAFSYTRHLDDRWSITASEQVQFFKRLYSLDVMGTYRLPVGKSNVYFDGRLLFNRYDRWRMNEPVLHLSALYEGRYVDFRLGASYIHYIMMGVNQSITDATYTEPVAVTAGFGVNLRPRPNPWNAGFFIRNYDHFYYENWNINWGFRGHYTLSDAMLLYGELNVRPAGSLSQLATRYETSAKLGLRYIL